MQLPNHMRSAAVDRERELKQNDLALLAAKHADTERIRIMRGDLADKRFIERATKEYWQ